MKYKQRRIPLGQIASAHPLVMKADTQSDPQYMLRADSLGEESVAALIEAFPLPVARHGEALVALGEPRILALAQAKLSAGKRIPVRDYTDSEDLDVLLWASTSLRPITHALQRKGCAATLYGMARQIPPTLARSWSPAFATMREFASSVGLSHSACAPPKRKSDESQSERRSRPLDRILGRVNGDD